MLVFLFWQCVLPGKGCWWQPRTRTAPAVANVVATHGSAGIHAFSAPPRQGPFHFFWTAHGTHHTYPLEMFLPHMQKACFPNGFQRFSNNRKIPHAAQRDSSECTMFHLPGHAKTNDFPMIFIVWHCDLWARRGGCIASLPGTCLPGC